MTEPKTFQKAYAFVVEIEGFKSISFVTCDGIDFRTAGDHPGILRLTRRHDVRDMDFLFWYKFPMENSRQGRMIKIMFLDRGGNISARYQIEKTRLIGLKFSELNNGEDSNLMEIAEIEYKSIAFVLPTKQELAERRQREEKALEDMLDRAQLEVEKAEKAFNAARYGKGIARQSFTEAMDKIREKYEAKAE